MSMNTVYIIIYIFLFCLLNAKKKKKAFLGQYCWVNQGHKSGSSKQLQGCEWISTDHRMIVYKVFQEANYTVSYFCFCVPPKLFLHVTGKWAVFDWSEFLGLQRQYVQYRAGQPMFVTWLQNSLLCYFMPLIKYNNLITVATTTKLHSWWI